MTLVTLARRAGTARVAGFLLLAVAAAALEVVGVLLLYLFGLGLATGLTAAPSLPGTSMLPDLTTVEGLLIIGLEIVAIKIVHGVVVVLLQRSAFRIQFDLAAALTSARFGRYLREPYLKHLRTNNAVRVTRLTEEMDRASRAMEAALRIGTHGVSLLLVATLMVLLDWRASLSGLVLMGVFALGLRSLLGGMSDYGRRKSDLHRALAVAVTEPLRNLRAVRVAHAENRFEQALTDLHGRLRPLFDAYTVRRVAVVPTIELGVLTALVALLALLVQLGRPLDEILASLVLVLVGATRMLPGFLQVATASGDWWFHRNALQEVLADTEREPDVPDRAHIRPAQDGDLVRLQGASFAYDGRPVLNSVDLRIRRGHRVGIVGPSGVGKSTLIDVCLGLLPAEGIIENAPGLRVGYVSQNAPVLDGTVLDNVVLGAPNDPDARRRACEAVTSAGLVLDDDRDATLDRLVGESGSRLSGGQRQRLCLARALYIRPEILVLDEPTASLDASSEQALIEVLDGLEVAMLLVTHRTAPLALCDEVHRIRDGQLVPEPPAGGPATGTTGLQSPRVPPERISSERDSP